VKVQSFVLSDVIPYPGQQYQVEEPKRKYKSKCSLN